MVNLVSDYMSYDKIEQIHSKDSNLTPEEIFTTKFYLERVIEIMESIPVHKNFIKDAICNLPIVGQFYSAM